MNVDQIPDQPSHKLTQVLCESSVGLNHPPRAPGRGLSLRQPLLPGPGEAAPFFVTSSVDSAGIRVSFHLQPALLAVFWAKPICPVT